MSFDRLNDDMKLAIVNKLNFNAVNALRMCNRNSYSFVTRFSNHLNCAKTIEKAEFRPSTVRWTECTTQGEKVEHIKRTEVAARCLQGRTIKYMKVFTSEDLVQFCGDSGVAVRHLDVHSLPEPTCLPEILSVLQPHRLYLFARNDKTIESWNQQLTAGIEDLFIFSINNSRKRPKVPVSIPLGVKTLLTDDVNICENSLNRAIKNWVAGQQEIVKYTARGIINVTMVDRSELFEGIDISAALTTDAVTNVVTIRRNDEELLKVSWGLELIIEPISVDSLTALERKAIAAPRLKVARDNMRPIPGPNASSTVGWLRYMKK